MRYAAQVKNANDTLVTERLWLRRFTPQDLDLLLRLHEDERVMRYAGGVRTRNQTEEMLVGPILGSYQEHPGLGGAP